MIDPQLKRGFKNFFFDTLDSYQLYSANKQQRVENEAALAAFINRFHKRYPTSKLIVNRGFEIIDTIHDSIEAVLFESYYKGVGHTKKQPYKDVSDEDRKWFDFWLAKVRSYHKDIISVEYMSPHDIYLSSLPEKIIQKIQAHGMIPYIANKELDIYGKSSKKVIKREIFTLINESRKLDRIDTAAHRNGALVFEYFGYKQHLHDIHKGLPKMKYMHQYAGVVVWMEGNFGLKKKLVQWMRKLIQNKIKVVIVNQSGFQFPKEDLSFLGLEVTQTTAQKVAVAYRDKRFIGYEIAPPLYTSKEHITLKKGRGLLVYHYSDDTNATPVALT